MLQTTIKMNNFYNGETGIPSIMKDAENGKKNKAKWIGE
jgi:hypothetical protein